MRGFYSNRSMECLLRITTEPESLTQCQRSTPEEYFWLYLIGIVVEVGSTSLEMGIADAGKDHYIYIPHP